MVRLYDGTDPDKTEHNFYIPQRSSQGPLLQTWIDFNPSMEK